MDAELIPFHKIKTRRDYALTANEVAFCHAIFAKRNQATDAYLEYIANEGTDRASAQVCASRLRNRRDIRLYLRTLAKHAFDAARVTSDRLISTAAAIAHADRTKVFNDDNSIKPVKEWPAEVREAVDGLKIKEYYQKQKNPDTDEWEDVLVRREIDIRCGGAKLEAIKLLMQFKNLMGRDADEKNGVQTDRKIVFEIVEPKQKAPLAELQ